MNGSIVQWTLVAVVVAGSALYAAWTLMPAALRRVLAGAALKLPLPARVATRLRRHASASPACGCHGCDRNPNASPTSTGAAREPTVRPITLHRRSPG